MEHCGVDGFGLISPALRAGRYPQAVDRLYEGVIVCVACRADRRCDPFEFEVFGDRMDVYRLLFTGATVCQSSASQE